VTPARYRELVAAAVLETVSDQRISLMTLAEVAEAGRSIETFLSDVLDVAGEALDALPDPDDSQLALAL
jgi:hypothetical protein